MIRLLFGVALAGFIAGVVLLAKDAWGHDFYPLYCCAGQDCAPISGLGAIERRDDGWFIKETGETIPFAQAKASPDLSFHRCRKKASDPNSATRAGCFWAPTPGG